MLDKYKQAGAADLAFLRDMRNLARRLDQPCTTVVLSDQFQDGNFEDNPKWRVTSGVYWIEKNWGGATERRQQTSQGTAAPLFGQILNKALGGKQKSTTQQPNKQTRTTIHTAANILNSFSLTASIRTGATENGHFIIAMYQGNFSVRSRAMGYRLAYKLGGSLDLVKLTSRGSTVLGTTILRRPLEDNKFRTTVWQLSTDGRMVVSVDGQEILSTNDGRFSNPFNGLALINRGGITS